MNYKQLSPEERYGIVLLLSKGVSLRKIGSNLKRSASTISREIKECHVAMDCKICYPKSSSLSEDILTLLKGKQQD